MAVSALGGVAKHSEAGGLGADDHAQYVRVNGDRGVILDAPAKSFTVQGAASQTANIATFRNSGGTPLVRVGPTGIISVGGTSEDILTGTFISPTTGRLAINQQAAGAPSPCLVVKGAVSQTGNLAEFQDSTGALVGVVKPDGSTTLKKTIQVPHTWGISGDVKVASGQTDYILPFFVPVPIGQTVRVMGARHKLGQGNANVTLTRWNTAHMTGVQIIGSAFTPTAVTTTATSTTLGTPEIVASNESLALEILAVSNTPKNLSYTIYLEYTV